MLISLVEKQESSSDRKTVGLFCRNAAFRDYEANIENSVRILCTVL